jgi:hypothetical protein
MLRLVVTKLPFPPTEGTGAKIPFSERVNQFALNGGGDNARGVPPTERVARKKHNQTGSKRPPGTHLE